MATSSRCGQAWEQRGTLLDPETPGVLTPRRRVGQTLLGRRTVEPDAPPHLGRRARQGRCCEDGHDAQHFEGIAEDGVDLGTGVELPRFVRLEMRVGLT